MNGLYPIIRRARRPLVAVEVATGGAGAKPLPEVKMSDRQAEADSSDSSASSATGTHLQRTRMQSAERSRGTAVPGGDSCGEGKRDE